MQPSYEYEWESLSQYESDGKYEVEYEGEYEDEFEGEWESEYSPSLEMEYEGLFDRVKKAYQAWQVGRAINNGNPNVPPVREPVPIVRPQYPRPAQQPRTPYREYEDEYEAANPMRRVYADVVMGHLGHVADLAQNEAEAEAMIGAMVPLALQASVREAYNEAGEGEAEHAVRRAATAVMRAAPYLIRGAAGLARTFRRDPAVRGLVQTLPPVLRATANALVNRAARGGSITPQVTLRALEQQCRRMYSNPALVQQTLQRARAADQAYHRSTAQGAPMPRRRGASANRTAARRPTRRTSGGRSRGG